MNEIPQVEKIVNPEAAMLDSQQGKILRQVALYHAAGLWSEPTNFDKYRFRVTPDRVELSPVITNQIESVNDALFAREGVITGTIRLVDQLAQPEAPSGISRWRRRIKHLRRALDIDKPVSPPYGYTPSLVRVDLGIMEAGLNERERIKIFEIEGDKTHALGYSAMASLARSIVFDVESMRPDMPGVAKYIVDRCQQDRMIAGRLSDSPLVIPVGYWERFYEAELEFLAGYLTELGVESTMLPEQKIVIENGAVRLPDARQATVLLGLNERYFKRKDLIKLYRQGNLLTFIPPISPLANKALLGILANSAEDEVIDMLLRRNIDPESLEAIRRFLPSAALVLTDSERKYWQDRVNQEADRWVVKRLDASGAKGNALPGEPDKQQQLLDLVQQGIPVIVQEYVPTQKSVIRYAEPDEPKNVRAETMYSRIEAFCTPAGPVDVLLTYNTNPAVHGQKDSVQVAPFVGGVVNYSPERLVRSPEGFNRAERILLNKYYDTLPQVIVAVRHAESQADKEDPQRALTELGFRQVKLTAQGLNQIADGVSSVEIYTTPTERTRQTAQKLADELNIEGAAILELTARVLSGGDWNLVNAETQARGSTSQTETYFQLTDEKKLPQGMRSPRTVANNTLYYMAKRIDKGGSNPPDVAILVGHAGTLDALRMQRFYRPADQEQWQDEFVPAEWRVLELLSKDEIGVTEIDWGTFGEESL